MTYDTMNPVPSTDPRDLYDNAGITDKYVNGQEPFVPDRLGVQRRTWKGMEVDFNNAQEGRQEAFDQFLEASAFINIGDYGPGITFTSRSQYIVRDGYAYRLALSTTLPYTTTGNWALEQNKFSLVNSDDILRQDLSGDTGAGLIGWIRTAVGAVSTTVAKWLQRQDYIDPFDFATDAQIADIKGSSTGDHTAIITAALTHAFTKLPCTVRLPKGRINYTTLPNLAKRGLTIQGRGFLESVLRCTGTGTGGSALVANAFASGSPSDQFIMDCNLYDFTVEGNSAITKIVDVQGVARSAWRLNAREANHTTGVAFDLKGVMLSDLRGLRCSTDFNAMTNIPATGIRLDEGRRANLAGGTDSVGQSSNNILSSAYLEGVGKGIDAVRADQCVLLSGSPESCTVYGLVIGVNSRFNTVIGTGFESKDAIADIADAGVSTRLINIYSSKSILLQGRGGSIQGGFFERIEVQAGAAKYSINDVTVNQWNTGAGGFFDSGTSTQYSNIYDAKVGQFIYPKKTRTAISFGASPFTWVNNTGQYVDVIVQGGTFTQIRQGDGSGDLWLIPATSPNKITLRPLDVAEWSFSAPPSSASYIRHNSLPA